MDFSGLEREKVFFPISLPVRAHSLNLLPRYTVPQYRIGYLKLVGPASITSRDDMYQALHVFQSGYTSSYFRLHLQRWRVTTGLR